jgi:hypothetical protein
MDDSQTRRSDRVAIELPISVSGTDALGRVFVEETVTVVISRHGAKIALSRKLYPDQELTIRVLGSPRELEARVVGQTGTSGGVFHYGVEVLGEESAGPFWGVEFPDRDAASFARAILECPHCATRELVYLNELEAEVLEVNGLLTRFCKRCAEDSLWKPAVVSADEEKAAPESAPPAAPPRRTRNDRKHVRVSLQVDVGIRHPHLGDEVATTENVSRGGLRFRSRRTYEMGTKIQIAFPYTRDGGNVFVPAQIVYAGTVPEEEMRVYGVTYLSEAAARRGR